MARSEAFEALAGAIDLRTLSPQIPKPWSTAIPTRIEECRAILLFLGAGSLLSTCIHPEGHRIFFCCRALPTFIVTEGPHTHRLLSTP